MAQSDRDFEGLVGDEDDVVSGRGDDIERQGVIRVGLLGTGGGTGEGGWGIGVTGDGG